MHSLLCSVALFCLLGSQKSHNRQQETYQRERGRFLSCKAGSRDLLCKAGEKGLSERERGKAASLKIGVETSEELTVTL